MPIRWLMTDERVAELLPLIRRLPRGTGVVFRHHSTPFAERARLLTAVRQIAGRRGLVLTVAGESHGRRRGRVHRGHGWPVHNRGEAMRGVAAGAALLFVSPVFPTRSHPGARPLGARKAAAIAAGLNVPAIALGGMDARRFAGMRGFAGWAGIDAFAAPRRQKRKAVPI